MFYKFQRRFNLLEVDDEFAILTNVDKSGDLHFEFLYGLSQKEAVVRETSIVSISVISRHVTKPSVLDGSSIGKINAKKVVDNVLSLVSNAKNSSEQQNEFIIAKKNGDVSSKINNDLLPQLKNKKKSDIPQLNKSKLQLVAAGSLKQDNVVKPILTLTTHGTDSAMSSSYVTQTNKSLMYDMITVQGKDPSAIVLQNSKTISTADALGGTLRGKRAEEYETSAETKLLQKHLDVSKVPVTTTDVSDSKLVQVYSSQVNDNVAMRTSVVIPRKKLNLEGKDNFHFFVKFDLISSKTGLAIDSVLKPLDVSKHISIFYTPKKAPLVRVSKSEVSDRVTLQIKQVDPAASAVKVFKKTVYHSVSDVDDYTLIGTYDVTNVQQALPVHVSKPKQSSTIFRVIPIGQQGNLGSEFTNVVVNPNKYVPIKSLSLNAQVIDLGVKLEAKNIPDRVVAIEFKVRNLSIFERDYRTVGGDVAFVDQRVRSVDQVTVVDRNAVVGDVFEYVAKLIYRDGRTEIVGNSTIEVTKHAPGKVDTSITNVVIDRDEQLNVRFSISTNVLDNELDIVKRLLQRQDVYDLFKDDVLREREFLKSLIAHNVQRVNLTSGQREDFGIISVSDFDDRSGRKTLAIEPLKRGNKYRYEITALLRAPETMFESFRKEKIDPLTKKTFSFSPAKFMHPVTLTRGTLVSKAGLKTRFSKDAMSHGSIGATEFVEVSFENSVPFLTNPAASRFNKKLNVLTWKIKGSIDDVDHFLIAKLIDGQKTLVGKVHSEFQYGNCQFLHELTSHDIGSVSYTITPVFNNYETGESIVTNNVIVESVV